MPRPSVRLISSFLGLRILTASASFCTSCGLPLSPQDRFCAACGVAAADRHGPPVQDTQESSQDLAEDVALVAAALALYAGILCFGIAWSTVLACGPNACTESLLAPGVLVGIAVVVLGVVTVSSHWTGLTRPASITLACLAALAALGSALTGLLWAGVFFAQFFGDKTNPWRGSLFAGPSQLLVLVNNYGSGKIRWEGGTLVAATQISALTIGFIGAAAALVICAIGLFRNRHRRVPISLRNPFARPVALVSAALVALVLVGYIILATPVIATESAADRAARSLLDADRHLNSRYSAALASFNASSKSSTDVQILALGAASAYAAFDRQLVDIRFPDGVRSDVNTVIQADAMVVSACNNLGAVASLQDQRTLVTQFDEARTTQRAALEILFKDLVAPYLVDN